MKTSKLFGLAVVAVGLMTVANTGCASDASQDIQDDPQGEEPEAVGETQQELNGCAIASSIAGAATGFAVSAWYTTGACAGGTLVTTGGAATPICVVPAAAGAASVLAGVAAGGIAYMACTNAGTQTITKAKTQSRNNCPRNERFEPTMTHYVQQCFTKKNEIRCNTSLHYPCAGPHTHGFLNYQELRGSNCVQVRKKAVQCQGAMAPPGPCQGPTTYCGQGGGAYSGIYVQ